MSERKDTSMRTLGLGAAIAVVFQTALLGLSLAVPSLADTLSVPEGVRVLRDLEYVEKGHERNRLDLYLPDKAAYASPVTYVSRDSAPFLILHGDKDSKVPIAQSIELVEALQKAGVEATLVTVSGGDHGGPQYTDSDRMRRITDFFDQWLCGKSR